ncbi:MAG: BMP family ABC transporter substrate-binding protein [Treponema sp.]|nr:BMP family ABC transporter substrate-binding protein [Treponema sp.]
MKLFKSCIYILYAVFALGITSCGNTNKQSVSIAVFVPGILSDSPIYDQLVKGAQQAVDEHTSQLPNGKDSVKLTVLEAGTNQAEWGNKLTALAATRNYSVIISSNPSMPEIADTVLKQFPDQKFIFLDAYRNQNTNMYTVLYNQHQQAFITGYIAALMSKTHRIGLIAAQQYPIMDNDILPGYKEGAAYANPETTVDYRIVGNWYDASKGAELTRAMADSQVDVILPICGGASQGVIATAIENHQYVAWFDSNAYNKAPGTIISSTTNRQQQMSYSVTKDFLNKTIPWGTAKIVGFEDDSLIFIQDDPLYQQTVPEAIRTQVANTIQDIKTGKISISMTQ